MSKGIDRSNKSKSHVVTVRGLGFSLEKKFTNVLQYMTMWKCHFAVLHIFLLAKGQGWILHINPQISLWLLKSENIKGGQPAKSTENSDLNGNWLVDL